MEKNCKNWYFTFGCGTANHDKYVRIKADSESKARDLMISKFGTHWAFDYSEEDWIIDPKKDPHWETKARWYGIDPNRVEPITQAELYNLSEIYLGVAK